LKDPVEEIILDDGSEQLGNFREILLGISVQESVLVEQSVEHACVNFLFFDLWRFLEVLHRLNELLYSAINFIVVGREHPLEVLIGCSIDFF